MAAQGGGGRQKFFKVLLPGTFESRLCLPPKFAARLGCPGGATATLRDPAGRPWDVELNRDDEHQHNLYFAGRGWRSFVAGSGLSAGHLLVFEHRGGLDFAVDPFDESGCLDEYAAEGKRACGHRMGHNTRATATADMESGNDECRRPCAAGSNKRKRSPGTANSGSCQQQEDETLCRHIERPYQLRYLDLNKSFCDRVGWTTSRTAELSVAGGDTEKEQSRRWQVSVKVSGKGGMICGGWADFAQDNRLNVSDTCVFKPLLLGGLQVQLLRSPFGPHQPSLI